MAPYCLKYNFMFNNICKHIMKLRFCAINKSQHHLNMFQFTKHKFPNLIVILPYLFCPIILKRFFSLYNFSIIIAIEFICLRLFPCIFPRNTFRNYESLIPHSKLLLLSVTVYTIYYVNFTPKCALFSVFCLMCPRILFN